MQCHASSGQVALLLLYESNHHPFHAFAVKLAARLLLFPPEGGLITTRQASLNAADRLVAPSNEASDAGLRPGPFPNQAASLLPGLLAATRTGLTPAGDDELMLDHDLHIDLQPWAHSRNRVSTRPAPAAPLAEKQGRGPISSPAPTVVDHRVARLATSRSTAPAGQDPLFLAPASGARRRGWLCPQGTAPSRPARCRVVTSWGATRRSSSSLWR